jgi:hypothetical protein
MELRERTESIKLETSICPLCKCNNYTKIGNEFCENCSKCLDENGNSIENKSY